DHRRLQRGERKRVARAVVRQAAGAAGEFGKADDEDEPRDTQEEPEGDREVAHEEVAPEGEADHGWPSVGAADMLERRERIRFRARLHRLPIFSMTEVGNSNTLFVAMK